MFKIEQTYHGWSWERISRHIFYWSAWLLFYSIIGSSNYITIGFWEWTGLELLIMCIKLPFIYFAIYYLVPQYLIPKRFTTFFSKLLITATIGGIIIWALYFFKFNPIYFAKGAAPYFWSKNVFYKILDLIYIASPPIILKMLQHQTLQEKQNALLVEQKLNAELRVLKNQLHPHFLFNTLNNLYSLVLVQHPKSADVVLRLSDMMSYMLYECERPLINLEKEIEHLNNYIELEKIRHGKRLNFSFETGGDVQNKSIAPLLLLPFLENAFKHGVEKDEKNSWIRINLWVENNHLTFLVENSLPENKEEEDLPKTQSGVGLVNVKKRLELLYPENHNLEIIENESFLIKLNLNLNNEMPHS